MKAVPVSLFLLLALVVLQGAEVSFGKSCGPFSMDRCSISVCNSKCPPGGGQCRAVDMCFCNRCF